VGSTPNWQQLAYDAAHLAITLGIIVVFLIFVVWLSGKTLKDFGPFLKSAVKAEFTQSNGLLDLAMFVVFCVFVYGHALTERVFAALGLAQLLADPHLWNQDVKTLCTTFCFGASLLVVSLVKPQQPKL